jgi:acyl carrier protein
MADLNGARLETLKEIFRIVLELDDGADLQRVTKISVRRWDSLATVSIVSAIESEFDIRLDTNDHERLTSFAAAKLLLEERLS